MNMLHKCCKQKKTTVQLPMKVARKPGTSRRYSRGWLDDFVLSGHADVA